ncbi:MAG TPA: type II toxin-antitoxin system RelE/ParE family toxin [Blastocatellia bacterium]|nr:type II toxin-antitoxin system RelE/ParE family toxin [Blastocatellia bacterium]
MRARYRLRSLHSKHAGLLTKGTHFDHPLAEKHLATNVLSRFFAGQWATLHVVTSCVTLQQVIASFRHKGLKRFFESGDLRGIAAQHGARIRRELDVLDAAREVTDMSLPGWKLHQLKGARKGTWAVSVSGNWRITFRFEGGDASWRTTIDE